MLLFSIASGWFCNKAPELGYRPHVHRGKIIDYLRSFSEVAESCCWLEGNKSPTKIDFLAETTAKLGGEWLQGGSKNTGLSFMSQIHLQTEATQGFRAVKHRCSIRRERKEAAPTWGLVFSFWRLYSNVLNKLNSGTSGVNDSVTEEWQSSFQIILFSMSLWLGSTFLNHPWVGMDYLLTTHGHLVSRNRLVGSQMGWWQWFSMCAFSYYSKKHYLLHFFWILP